MRCHLARRRKYHNASIFSAQCPNMLPGNDIACDVARAPRRKPSQHNLQLLHYRDSRSGLVLVLSFFVCWCLCFVCWLLVCLCLLLGFCLCFLGSVVASFC